MVKSFMDLILWQKAHKFVLDSYEITRDFQKNETYGLTSQIRRSAASVPTNIVEGHARKHTKEFIQSLYVSKGSLEETKYHLLLAKDLGYLKVEKYNTIIDQSEEIGRMLSKFIKSLEERATNRGKR